MVSDKNGGLIAETIFSGSKKWVIYDQFGLQIKSVNWMINLDFESWEKLSEMGPDRKTAG